MTDTIMQNADASGPMLSVTPTSLSGTHYFGELLTVTANASASLWDPSFGDTLQLDGYQGTATPLPGRPISKAISGPNTTLTTEVALKAIGGKSTFYADTTKNGKRTNYQSDAAHSFSATGIKLAYAGKVYQGARYFEGVSTVVPPTTWGQNKPGQLDSQAVMLKSADNTQVDNNAQYAITLSVHEVNGVPEGNLDLKNDLAVYLWNGTTFSAMNPPGAYGADEKSIFLASDASGVCQFSIVPATGTDTKTGYAILDLAGGNLTSPTSLAVMIGNPVPAGYPPPGITELTGQYIDLSDPGVGNTFHITIDNPDLETGRYLSLAFNGKIDPTFLTQYARGRNGDVVFAITPEQLQNNSAIKKIGDPSEMTPATMNTLSYVVMDPDYGLILSEQAGFWVVLGEGSNVNPFGPPVGNIPATPKLSPDLYTYLIQDLANGLKVTVDWSGSPSWAPQPNQYVFVTLYLNGYYAGGQEVHQNTPSASYQVQPGDTSHTFLFDALTFAQYGPKDGHQYELPVLQAQFAISDSSDISTAIYTSGAVTRNFDTVVAGS